jgi:uncharacterized membrane protein YGL010W
MGVGVSILLIAVGAVLAFAVSAEANGIDIQTVGWIVLVVGIVGLVLSMIFWSSWAGPGYFSSRRRTVVDDAPATRRTTVVEDGPGY